MPPQASVLRRATMTHGSFSALVPLCAPLCAQPGAASIGAQTRADAAICAARAACVMRSPAHSLSAMAVSPPSLVAAAAARTQPRLHAHVQSSALRPPRTVTTCLTPCGKVGLRAQGTAPGINPMLCVCAASKHDSAGANSGGSPFHLDSHCTCLECC